MVPIWWDGESDPNRIRFRFRFRRGSDLGGLDGCYQDVTNPLVPNVKDLRNLVPGKPFVVQVPNLPGRGSDRTDMVHLILVQDLICLFHFSIPSKNQIDLI